MRKPILIVALLALPGHGALAQTRTPSCEPMPACLVLRGPEPGRPGYQLPQVAPPRTRETLLPSQNSVPTAPAVPKPR